MDYSQHTNLELVQYLLGDDYATKLYRGMLAPLFLPKEVLEVNQEALGAATELIERWADHGFQLPALLSGPVLIREFVRISFAKRKTEGFAILLLDAAHQLKSIEELFQGPLGETRETARAIVRRLRDRDGISGIFVHHLVAGKAEPGSVDIWLATQLKQVLDILDIEIVDYLVVVGGESVSLAERGVLA